MSDSPDITQRMSLEENGELSDDVTTFTPQISPFAKQIQQDHISKRAKQILEESNKKLQQIAQKLEEKYQNFSYKPQITEYKFEHEREKFHQVIDKRVHEKEEYYKKMEKLKSDNEKKQTLEKPQICTYSKTLDRSEPIHERLYKLRKNMPNTTNTSGRQSLDSTPSNVPPLNLNAATNNNARASCSSVEDTSDADCTFTPRILADPKYLDNAKRQGKIEDRMYNDYIMREKRREALLQQQEVHDAMARRPVISDRTRQLARQRLKKELEKAFEESAKAKKENDVTVQYLDYVRLGDCLASLGLFKSGNSKNERRTEQEVRIHEDIWNVMDPHDDGLVYFTTFFHVLAPLIDPDLFPPSKHSSIKERDGTIREVPPHKMKRLASQIKDLAVNKLAYASRKVDPSKILQPTFQPAINPISRSLDLMKADESSMSPCARDSIDSKKRGPRYEVLFQKSSEKQKKVDELRKNLEEKEMKECSFRPQLFTQQKKRNSAAPGSRFEQLYNQRNKTIQKPIHRTTEEKEMEIHCTFQPKTNNPKRDNYKPPESAVNHRQVRGFEKIIGRMRKGKEQRDAVNNFFSQLREETNARWDGRFEKAKDHGYFSPTQVKPFDFQLDKRKRSKPMLYMDVNLGPGKTGRIGIHENDNPRLLAKNFAASYRLDGSLTNRLEELIRNQMIANQIPIGNNSDTPRRHSMGSPQTTTDMRSGPTKRIPAGSSNNRSPVQHFFRSPSSFHASHSRNTPQGQGYTPVDESIRDDEDDDYEDEFVNSRNQSSSTNPVLLMSRLEEEEHSHHSSPHGGSSHSSQRWPEQGSSHRSGGGGGGDTTLETGDDDPQSDASLRRYFETLVQLKQFAEDSREI